jgi:glycosyltransferase involved in cell wall biosynthesis
MKCSLIISTYNWPEALDLVLKSVLRQKTMPLEVVIADDGSNTKTLLLIEEYKKQIPVPLIHVWQEDAGFQKCKILNKAILKTNSDYIIQVDGDVILNKNFIKDHLKFAKPNQYLFGSRVNIKEKKLFELFKNKNVNINFFTSRIGKRFRALRLPIFNIFINKNYQVVKKLRGCNISYWKSDVLKINGYNEDFIGWGGEDYEFAHRLHLSGVTGKRIKHAAIVYHIYHKESSKENCYKNAVVQQKSFDSGNFFVPNGIQKI